MLGSECSVSGICHPVYSLDCELPEHAPLTDIAPWVYYDDPALAPADYRLARGVYQRAFATGRQALSGSTLSGKAARYSGRYRDSARHFLARLRRAGMITHVITAPFGVRRRLVIIGAAVSPLDSSERCAVSQ